MSDMIIRITSEGYTTTFQLYDTKAAAELYAQLPLELELSNFADAPWDDVVMFYEDFGSASGLYELGQAVSGSDYISGMSGTIEIHQSEC